MKTIFFYLLLIHFALYCSDAKKMHRSRVRQEWDFQCAKGETISGLTAQHVIDDVVVTFSCESLSSSGSPSLEEGICRETKEFQVFKDGKLTPEGAESGCKSSEYLKGVKSSVTGKGTTFGRKLLFKCCKAKNADMDESGCHTVGPKQPFHFKTGEIINLKNTAKPGPSCPKYGLSTFFVDHSGFTLKYCTWTIKDANYPESCSNQPTESAEPVASDQSNEKITDPVSPKKKDRQRHKEDNAQETIADTPAVLVDSDTKSNEQPEISESQDATPTTEESESQNKPVATTRQVVRATSHTKQSGLSGRKIGHTTAVTDQASATEQTDEKNLSVSEESVDEDDETTATAATEVPSTKKPQASHIRRSHRINHNEQRTAAPHQPVASQAQPHSPSKPKHTHTHVKILPEAPQSDPNTGRAVMDTENVEEESTETETEPTKKPKNHVIVLPAKQPKTVEPPQSDKAEEPVVILTSIDEVPEVPEEPRIHIHEETIAIPKDIAAEKSSAQSASSVSGLLKCKPGSVGNQKWSCFAGDHCDTDKSCTTKCNTWQPGLDFGTLATTKCVAGNEKEQYCCCTYEGQGQTDCPAANDKRGNTKENDDKVVQALVAMRGKNL